MELLLDAVDGDVMVIRLSLLLASIFLILLVLMRERAKDAAAFQLEHLSTLLKDQTRKSREKVSRNLGNLTSFKFSPHLFQRKLTLQLVLG